MNDTIFNLGTVVLEIESQNKADAIREIISRAEVFDCISDKARFIEAVFAREEQGSCVGHGVAFAHGKITEISEMKIALGISRKGIEYNPPEENPVHLFFVVATNPSMYLDYLQRLAILVKMVRREDFRGEILSCFAREEVVEKLRKTFLLCREKKTL
jgi:mannitol/fructose-specific phosphotransferase system IIA component (Ntr-type)